jgi:hypothetical protein
MRLPAHCNSRAAMPNRYRTSDRQIPVQRTPAADFLRHDLIASPSVNPASQQLPMTGSLDGLDWFSQEPDSRG